MRFKMKETVRIRPDLKQYVDGGRLAMPDGDGVGLVSDMVALFGSCGTVVNVSPSGSHTHYRIYSELVHDTWLWPESALVTTAGDFVEPLL